MGMYGIHEIGWKYYNAAGMLVGDRSFRIFMDSPSCNSPAMRVKQVVAEPVMHYTSDAKVEIGGALLNTLYGGGEGTGDILEDNDSLKCLYRL